MLHLKFQSGQTTKSCPLLIIIIGVSWSFGCNMRGAIQDTVNPLRPGYDDRGLADDISNLSYSMKIVVNCFKFDDILF